MKKIFRLKKIKQERGQIFLIMLLQEKENCKCQLLLKKDQNNYLAFILNSSRSNRYNKTTKKVLDKITKQVPPSEKKLFIEHDEKDNTYNIDEE